MMQPNRQPAPGLPETPTTIIGTAPVPEVRYPGPGWDPQGEGFTPHDNLTRPLDAEHGAPVSDDETLRLGIGSAESLERLGKLPAVPDEQLNNWWGGGELFSGAIFPVETGDDEIRGWQVNKVVFDPETNEYEVLAANAQGARQAFPLQTVLATKQKVLQKAVASRNPFKGKY